MRTKIFFRTYGCTLNQADSLAAKRFVEKSGYTVTESQDEAGCVVLFTCAVRRETEDRILSNAKELEGIGKKVVVASCLAASRPGKVLTSVPGAVVFVGADHEEIVQALEAHPGSLVYGRARTAVPTSSSMVYPLKISEGCVSNCYFCITKVARPRLWSRPSSEIVNVVNRAVQGGAVEVDLTSMDNADYFEPPATRLPALVLKILHETNLQFRLRLGMMNPAGALRILPALEPLFSDERLYRFLHIPLQSGDEEVVRSMNRHYEPLAVAKALSSLKERVTGLRVATDIMVGYPTETEEAFERTIALLRTGVFDKIHMFRFTPRSHTKAASMPQLGESVKKRRSEAASQVIRELHERKNRDYVNRTLRVLVTGCTASRDEARTENYTKVYLPYNPSLLGKFVYVTIRDTTPEHLVGEPLEDQNC